MRKQRDYHDELRTQIRLARKRQDFAAVIYYAQALATCCACAAWETFKGSWAGQAWLARKDVQTAISQLEAEAKRFAYMR